MRLNLLQKGINILLFGLLLFVSVLRFFSLSKFPDALNRDEASIGYNAYSILQTGKDEWGETFPLAFKSFGDYKMPAYIYLTTLPVRVFGLNGFSVRFWSALAGVVSLLLIYLLVLKWFGFKFVALIAALILALNPWHFYFSRFGFEANLNLMFILAGLGAFTFGIKKRWLLPFSALFFGLTFYTYSSTFLFLPLLLLVLAVVNLNIFKKVDFWIILAAVIFASLFLHGTWSVWQVSKAKTAITIFSDPTLIDNFNHLRTQMASSSPLMAKLWLNKPFYYFRIFLGNYLSSFSPNFLFFTGGSHPWHQIPGQGHFYILDMLFMALGAYYFFKVKLAGKVKVLLMAWLLLAPIPSALTIDAPHATRMLQIVPIIAIFVSIGWYFIFKKVKSNFILTGIMLLYLIQPSLYFYKYFVSYNRQLPLELMPGIRQAINYVQKDESRLVVFSRPLDAPYVYVAFYQQIAPQDLQEKAVWKPPDLANITAVEYYDRYRFFEGLPDINEKAYYVLQSDNVLSPAGFKLEKEIKDEERVLWRIFVN